MSFVPSDKLTDGRRSDRPPSKSTAARFVLREATAEAHARVDALFSRFDLGTGEGYVAFMRAQASANLTVEAALDRAGASDVVPDWEARRRVAALRQDLVALGIEATADVDPPRFDDAARILGGVYVLEGSRLGGALLRRSVSADLPTAFLSAGTPEAWRSFVALLDQLLVAPPLLEAATAAALATFATFERSAQISLDVRP